MTACHCPATATQKSFFLFPYLFLGLEKKLEEKMEQGASDLTDVSVCVCVRDMSTEWAKTVNLELTKLHAIKSCVLWS